MRRIVRRQHEDRLREVELARDLLHRRIVEPLRVKHDGKRISRKRPLSENVEDVVAAGHAFHDSSC